MTDRQKAKRDFLDNTGWADASLEFLAGDASMRSYDRVMRLSSGEAAVLMDAPPDLGNDLRPFVAITEELLSRGLSAPRLFAADGDQGFLLIEDLGDALFARVCRDNPAKEPVLYKAAIDTLVEIGQRPPPHDLGLYDPDTYMREAALVTQWYLPAVQDQPAPQADAELRRLIADACGALECPYTTLVLRDYHAENLLWLPDRTGTARVGLIDYQDALNGHAMYDLVSLLEDARRDTTPAFQAKMIEYYDQQTKGGFDALAYATLGAQRNLKILGIFTRLALRDGKFTYLSLMPRVWAHLQRDLAHPALEHLRAFVADHIPEPTPQILDLLDKAARNG